MLSSKNLEMEARVADTKKIDPLMEGAIDMHYHGYPEITLGVRARLDDADALKLAKSMGMRGIVIKSQMWPSMARTHFLKEMVPDIECFGSITLNSVCGGISPWVVDAAARQGARVVWMPTWSSAHKLGQDGFSRFMKEWFPTMNFEPGLSCLDASGALTADAKSVIAIAKERDLVLCTSHLPPTESLLIAEEAERIGFNRLVFTHPLSGSVSGTLEQTKEMAKRGAYVELIALNIFYANHLDKMLQFIEEIGPAHCILSTDAFMEWVPPGPEYLRMFVGRLFIAGVDEESIRLMVRDNPAKLLGLPPISAA
jgi:hypothetical protein